MSVIVVSDYSDRYIRGVYTSQKVAERSIIECYEQGGILTTEQKEEILALFEFLEFDVEG